MSLFRRVSANLTERSRLSTRLMLMIGIKNGWTGAQEAYNYLYPILAVQHAANRLPDLFERAGWAIALAGEI